MTRATPLLGAAAAILLWGACGTSPAEAQSPCGASHTVRSGDTLYALARKCGTTVSAIVAANDRIRNPARIGVGWTLAIPAGGSESGEGGGSAPAPPPGGDGSMEITGTLTRDGVECPALRSDGGKLYTLAGETGRFGPGDRVRVRGNRAQMSICQQGITISVESIEAAR